MPLALGMLPAMMSQALEAAPIHLGAVALAAVISGVCFVPGFRQHRDWRVLMLGAVGLGLLVLAQFALHEGPAEIGVTVAGGALLMVAHGLNRRRCRHDCAEAIGQRH